MPPLSMPPIVPPSSVPPSTEESSHLWASGESHMRLSGDLQLDAGSSQLRLSGDSQLRLSSEYISGDILRESLASGDLTGI